MKLLGNTQPKPIRYSVADAAIEEMRAQYLPLRIDGVDDGDGLKAVHAARMLVKGKRIEVEKTRKDLKAEALEYGRKVDAEAKRLKGLLVPIEAHLQQQEDAVKAEKARIKAEREAEAKRRLDERMAALAAVGHTAPPSVVELLDDESFEGYLAEQTKVHEERQAEEAARRVEQEAAERAEREALEARAAELKRQQEEQEAERRQLEEERRALLAERQAAERAKAEQENSRAAGRGTDPGGIPAKDKTEFGTPEGSDEPTGTSTPSPEPNPRGRDELTRDPVFLFQRARWIVTDHGVLEEFQRDKYAEESGREGGPEYVGSYAQWSYDWDPSLQDFKDLEAREAAVPHWDTERVWFTREEAEAYGRGRSYEYPLGWRVYCVCAEGKLAEILKRADELEGGA